MEMRGEGWGETGGLDKIFTLNLQGMVFLLDKGAVGA